MYVKYIGIPKKEDESISRYVFAFKKNTYFDSLTLKLLGIYANLVGHFVAYSQLCT
jgi:hypothetical protein